MRLDGVDYDGSDFLAGFGGIQADLRVDSLCGVD